MLGQTWQPGAQVTPSIRLVRLLGRGGMGSVWIADHLGLRTQVVVKFVSLELASVPEARERFEREAALAAQARSPHVVQVFDHGVTASGVPYIAMEHLEGEDLGARIAREGPIDPMVFSGWLTQACKGLGRAHAKGIVHRDIKPDNIFLSDVDGEIVVKVLDFGIAKAEGLGDLLGTKSGALMGTAPFMSPEQTFGVKGIDLRTDLWSMAVTTYVALTGERPFPQESIGAVVHAITDGPILPPSAHAPRLGPAVDAWMARALARPVDARFASAKEMAEAFALAVAQAVTGPFGTAFVPSRPSRPPPSPSGAPPPRAMTTSVGVVSEHLGDVRPIARVASPPPRATNNDRTMLVASAVVALGFLAALAIGARSFIADSASTSMPSASRSVPAPRISVAVEAAPAPRSAVATTTPTADPIDASPPGAETTLVGALTRPAAAPAKTAARPPANPEAKPTSTPKPTPTPTNPLHMGLE